MLWCFVKKCVKDIKIVEIFNHSFWKKKMCEILLRVIAVSFRKGTQWSE